MPQPTQQWRFIPLVVNDGFTNMAIDEAILVNCMKGAVPNTVRLYQWSPSTVSIGMHQSVKLEVDEAEIERRGFQLVRRISGGGAVLHAEGREITYAVVARVQDLLGLNNFARTKVDAVYENILRVIQKTVSQLSLSAASGVIHCPAVLVDGKKISGNAQCFKMSHVLQHGTILLSVDPDEMYSVLKPPEGVTKGRMVRSVKAKVTGLEDYTGHAISPKDFESKFLKSCSEIFGISFVEGNLTREEMELVNGLKEKYASTAWRYKYP
ncbi:MAG: biotin/lipoate A/B protein ligase family protein [Candidatus Sigynarchaeota archaeon]